jgi:hypothetical protein
MQELTTFESSNLKTTTLEEKSTLPSADDIHSERIHRELLTNIGDFDSKSLTKTDTDEKILLPDSENIQQVL